MPWYSLLGNHEVLRQGFAPGAHPAFDDARATGCRKPFPSDTFGPAQLGARSQAEALERLASPEVLEQLERDSRPVLGDPARRMVGKVELKRAAPGRRPPPRLRVRGPSPGQAIVRVRRLLRLEPAPRAFG